MVRKTYSIRDRYPGAFARKGVSQTFYPHMIGERHFARIGAKVGAAPVIPATVTYIGTDGYTGADQDPLTISAMGIGAAADRDLVIVGIQCHKGGTNLTAITGVTIGGVSATVLVSVDGNDGSNAEVVALAAAVVPTGTTADVVITGNNGIRNADVVVYTAKNVDTTAHDTQSSTAANPSATIAVTAGGIIIAYAATANGGITFTWTNLTEDVDIVGTGGGASSGASDAFAVADAARTITATLSSGSSRRAMGIVSYNAG